MGRRTATGGGRRDSHPCLPRQGGGVPGEPSATSAGGGRCTEGRRAAREAAAAPRLCFHSAEPAVEVKATSDDSPKAVTLASRVCGSAQPAAPRRTAWAAFWRHLVRPWASPGQWAPCQQRALGRSHRDGNRRERRMRQQMLFQGLCVREAAIHPRILILNKREVSSQGHRPRWLRVLCPLSST